MFRKYGYPNYFMKFVLIFIKSPVSGLTVTVYVN